VSSSTDQTLRIWKLSTGECSNILRGHTKEVWAVAVSPNGQMLASGSADQTVRVWETATGRCLKVLHGHDSGVKHVRFSPDNSMLVSSGTDIRLWDINAEHSRIVYESFNEVKNFDVSSNGRTLAIGLSDLTIRLWDIQAGTELDCLSEHRAQISSVAFRANDQHLASSNDDGVITLWQVQTGKCVKTLRNYRPYEHMNITGITGLTDAQKATLKVLGAFES
jgi:WD40 repeat protein